MSRFNEDTFLDKVFELETVEEADTPASLLRKLHKIPKENTAFTYRQKYIAVAALLLISMFTLSTQLLQTPQPSLTAMDTDTDGQRVRQELALAFHYIERSNRSAGRNIHSTLNAKLQQHTLVPVAKPALNIALKATTKNRF